MTDAIDLFAGAGGFTTGAKMAGLNVVWAGNHWRAAVDAHAKNHPATIHLCQDLHQADWSSVPRHDITLASPSCQGSTPARGRDKPHHDTARSTAWAVVSCTEFHRPEAVLVENVAGMLDWILFPAWCQAMEALGYAVSPQIIDAADCAVPQNRKRLLIACTKSKAKVALQIDKQPHVPVSRIVDFTKGKWTPVSHPRRSRKTMARVEAGRDAYGDRFVMPYYGSGSGLTGRSLERPLGTVTTRDRWALVDGDRMRMLSIPEYKAAMSFPDDYALPGCSKHLDLHLLGNAVPPLMARDALKALLAA